MTDRSRFAEYHDVLDDADDPALLVVLRELEQMYPRVAPPPRLMNLNHEQLSTAARPSERPISIKPDPHEPGRPAALSSGAWKDQLFGAVARRGYHRRATTLALAITLVASLAGGAAYGMHVLSGPPHPRLLTTCSSRSWSLSGPGTQVHSFRQFEADGGKVDPQAVKRAAGLAHPQYWVVSEGTDTPNSCNLTSMMTVQIGWNERNHTVLLAISITPIDMSKEKLWVGSLDLPTGHGCSPHPTGSPIIAPDRRPVAQLERPPPGLSQRISVVVTPCGVPIRAPAPHQPPNLAWENIHILSVVHYEGGQGRLQVSTARATEEAMLHHGLYLGNPVGTLPDGSPAFDLTCTGGCTYPHGIRWVKEGLIVSVSGNLSVMQLKALAADIVLR